MKVRLGVNIDHVATLRQARKEDQPDPIAAALIAEKNGADGIVAHLREDRRHIQDDDIKNLRKKLRKPLNLEMSLAPDIVRIACKIKPYQVTLVPEKRQEVTTEGGLDVMGSLRRLKKIVPEFQKRNILVSLFIDPVKKQIKACADLGVEAIEIHTGPYALAKTKEARSRQLQKIKTATNYAISLGIRVFAGHGLNYTNVKPIARIKGMEELNIGHSIISHSVFVGLPKAVRSMKALMK